MLGKVWSQVGSVPAVDPTGTQDLAPVRPSGEWTRVTWPHLVLLVVAASWAHCYLPSGLVVLFLP